MFPRIQTLTEKKLVGQRLKMSFANNKMSLLWSGFMPRRKAILNRLSEDLISMVIYSHNHFADFSPKNEFERWAAVEVSDFDVVPDGMENFVLPSGLYAVLHYKGLSSNPSIFRYLFETWLPQSEFELDNRPHFEVLGEKYKNNDPDSEEEIWIPVKPK